MSQPDQKTKRIEIKVPIQMAELFTMASDKLGLSVSEFMRMSALSRAREELVHSDDKDIVLSQDDWEAVIEELNNPSPATPALIELLGRKRR